MSYSTSLRAPADVGETARTAAALPAPPTLKGRVERWATIPGFTHKYQVSDLGRVLRRESFDTPDVRLWYPLMLTPTYSGGYFRVFLRASSHRRQYRIDRLMLCAFTGQPLAVFDVAYKNGDRRDLRLENLERLNTVTVLGPPSSRRRITRD